MRQQELRAQSLLALHRDNKRCWGFGAGHAFEEFGHWVVLAEDVVDLLNLNVAERFFVLEDGAGIVGSLAAMTTMGRVSSMRASPAA